MNREKEKKHTNVSGEHEVTNAAFQRRDIDVFGGMLKRARQDNVLHAIDLHGEPPPALPPKKKPRTKTERKRRKKKK